MLGGISGKHYKLRTSKGFRFTTGTLTEIAWEKLWVSIETNPI